MIIITYTAVVVTAGIFIGLTIILLAAEKRLVNYGTCIVSINDGSVTFEQEGGGTLLSALYNNKIYVPSACGGKGSCGYCKVTVVKGGGPVLPTETPYLTRAEVRAGIRLSCQVKVKENMEIRLPEEILSIREYRAVVVSIRQLTHDIKEINLDLLDDAEINHKPGQYVQVMAPSDDGPVYRAYSISSPVFEKKKVQLIVRLVPGGIASTYLHNLKEGDVVQFTGPFGEFQLSEDPETDVVLVGGGCGMAPIVNIIYSIYNQWPNRKVNLFFGARRTDDIFYLERFKKFAREHPNFNFTYALSDPLSEEEDWNGDTGFIHLSVDKRLTITQKHQAFLCGPPPMIEAVTDVLKTKKYEGDEIFYDKF
jgi:Na+-transporting NADH:ubiquinone oxidoreductase subunit F